MAPLAAAARAWVAYKGPVEAQAGAMVAAAGSVDSLVVEVAAGRAVARVAVMEAAAEAGRVAAKVKATVVAAAVAWAAAAVPMAGCKNSTCPARRPTHPRGRASPWLPLPCRLSARCSSSRSTPR